jgi:tRNA dimethylallyltransferase
MQSIGYRHANNYVDGVWNMDETMRLLIRDTRRYAKRQLTWFGSDPALHWFDRSATDDVIKFTENRLHDLS